MTEHKIYIKVSSGVASVDENSIPEGIEVVIHDLDVMIDNPEEFALLPIEDQNYLESQYPEIVESIKDAAGLTTDLMMNDDDGEIEEALEVDEVVREIPSGNLEQK